MTHDYKRHGTTTLFAALNVAEGVVIDKCMKRHRHQEWIAFLKEMAPRTPAELDLHLIADPRPQENWRDAQSPQDAAVAHASPTVPHALYPHQQKLAELGGEFFAELTNKRLRRGTFCSVPQLIKAIKEYVKDHNNHARGLKWPANAERILAKVRRARAKLDKVKSD